MSNTKKEKRVGARSIPTRTFKVNASKVPKYNSVKTAKMLGKIAKSQPAPSETPHIEIERPVQHISKGLSFYRVRFKDLEGKQCWLDIPRRLFTKPSEVVRLLLDAHADLPDIKQCIVEALEHVGSKPTLKLTDRLGWDDGVGDGSSFVYFDKTYGPAHDSLQLDDDPDRNAALGKKSGTLEKWREGLEEPCRFSDHLVFAIGVAASGPLYGIIGNPEPAIYHFQGAIKPPGDTRIFKSSSGKTLTAQGGQSMIGSCGRTELFGFNTTATALEETCFSCNNLLVVLDEQGTAGEGDGKALDPKSIPYRIIGGQGKRRSKAYAASHGLANRSWLVPVITTSEDELDPKGTVRNEGAQARMVPIPFPPTCDGGTFCTNDDADERNRLAKAVVDTIASNYGWAMPEFLRHLVKDRTTLAADILKLRDDFVKDVGATGNIWEKRYAEKFGMVLAAARLLLRYGIAPWTDERAVTAVTNLYKASRSLTVSVPQATDALLEKLRKEVAAKKRFPRVSKGQSLSADQKKEVWGVVREIGGKKNVTAVKPARFKKLVEPSAVSDLVLDELDARKLLVKNPDGNLKRQVAIKGLTEERARYVCIKGLVAKPH